MHFKTVTAPTMEDAIAQIRAVLGDDATLVSCVQEKNRVRVTAALEHVAPNIPPPLVKTGFQTIDTLCRALDYHMPPAGIADQWMGTLSRLDSNRLMGGVSACLNALISIAPLDFKDRSSVMVVGPSGAGKTLTLAKIASEYALMGARCQIVTLDSKSGSHPQLETYALAMGLTVFTAKTRKDLDEIIAAGRRDGIATLIDTPGLNPLDFAAQTALKKYIDQTPDAPILVIPGGADPLDILDYIQLYQNFGCRHLIYTKADTARRLGGLLTALSGEKNMTLSHISDGPWLGDQLTPASGDVVADYLLSFVENGYSSLLKPPTPLETRR